jgi:hypothetical protein
MPSDAPDRAICIPIQKYIDGIARHDTELLAEAFHDDAIMSSHLGGKFAIVPAKATIVAYMKSNPPVSETSPNFRGRILSIEQAGSMASATIAEDELEGLNFITFFHLHNLDGTWLITSKATFARPPVNDDSGSGTLKHFTSPRAPGGRPG